MNQDQITSIVRTVMKVGGGFLSAKGLAVSATDWETITGAIIILAGLIWSHTAHKEEPPTP